MVRRRRRTSYLPWAIVFGVIVALLVTLLVIVAVGTDRGSEEALEAMASARDEGGADGPVDPYAGREQDAIDKVQAHRSGREGEPTIGSLIGDGALTSSIPMYRQLGLDQGNWTARRVSGRTLYWVEWESTFHGISIGPRWLVQLDPEGRQPEGSNGVIPANALAEYLDVAEPVRYARFLSRSDAVLDVLLDHRFDTGLPLASAIVVYFAGRNRTLADTDLLGWAVVPQQAEEGGEVLYDAFFQWVEHERIRVAHFQVDLTSNQFEARNLLANEIVAEAGEMSQDDIVDIRPQSLDLSVSPRRERNPMLRALRYVLADERLVGAVGALLSFRAQSGEFSYDGWRVEPDGCEECTVRYRFEEGDREDSVSWEVGQRGEMNPTSRIATLAMRAISIAPPSEDDEQSNAAGAQDADSP